jgi:hypothetical protein
MTKKRNRISIFDLFQKDIEYYLKLGLSIRCIYLLIKDKLEKKRELEGNISYQGIRRYILANSNLSKYLRKT